MHKYCRRKLIGSTKLSDILPEELKEELRGLRRPTALRGAPGLGLRLTADAVVEVTERDDLLLLLHVLEEADGALDRHALDGARRLVRVLEVHAKVRAAGLARLRVVVRSLRVVDLAHFAA